MTITFNTPPYLIGQDAAKLFDGGGVGIARGSNPSGPLGATITLPSQFVTQAERLGFTYSSFSPG